MSVRNFFFRVIWVILAKISEKFRTSAASVLTAGVIFALDSLVGISSKVSVSLLDVVRVRVIVRVSCNQDVHTKELVETKKSGCTYRGTQY